MLPSVSSPDGSRRSGIFDRIPAGRRNPQSQYRDYLRASAYGPSHHDNESGLRYAVEQCDREAVGEHDRVSEAGRS